MLVYRDIPGLQWYCERKYGVEWGKGIPIPTTWRIWDLDVDEPIVLFPFRELIGALLWIALLTRPDIANAVRTSSFGSSFQKGTLTGLSLMSFADADYASRSTCLLYTSPSPRDKRQSRMPSSA